MRLVALTARILLGASLWTIGHFMIVVVIFLNLTHESIQSMLPQRPAAPAEAESSFVMRMLHPTAQSSAATAVIAGLCMYVGFLQVRRGMSPINQLRNRLAAVHKGVDARVGGAYPAEVQPGLDELNSLLAQPHPPLAPPVA